MMVWWLLACGVPDEMVAYHPFADIDRNIDRTARTGEVLEHLDAGSYIYVRVQGVGWVTGLRKPLQVGDEVVVRPLGVAEQFHSRRTDRTFDDLYFAVLEPAGG